MKPEAPDDTRPYGGPRPDREWSGLTKDNRTPALRASIKMTLRTTRTFVTFARPFWLDEVAELHSAGTYAIHTDEEEIEGLSFLSYRRVATTISLPLKAAPTGSFQVVTIDPAALEAALRRDGKAPGP